jgi:hypothetical protein
MDRTKEDPFYRKSPTLEELKVHAHQLTIPGMGKLVGVVMNGSAERVEAPETNGNNALASPVGKIALAGAQA